MLTPSILLLAHILCVCVCRWLGFRRVMTPPTSAVQYCAGVMSMKRGIWGTTQHDSSLCHQLKDAQAWLVPTEPSPISRFPSTRSLGWSSTYWVSRLQSVLYVVYPHNWPMMWGIIIPTYRRKTSRLRITNWPSQQVSEL